MRVGIRAFLFALAVVALTSCEAGADWLITGFGGANAGGATGDKKLDYGASLGFMRGGVIGVEADLGYSPDFFRPSGNQKLVSSSNVTTLTGNIIVGVPLGGGGLGVRPYVSGGFGLIRPNLKDPSALFTFKHNDFGGDVGGGVMVFFAQHVGIRGDIRYFRSVTHPTGANGFDIDFGTFSFWRATGGLVVKF
jgi:hypothetical protein